ncbi:30S ribosome-binding factor RbfA [Serpentinicella sp. ANB-PHB4]|uniref:30S ribosome-binding factor RbfA n=1 Tax=Serpentinicella sp. ANB-PHB4 TaxID=3074076 RepID=UPI00285EECF3|nr:30S ribosome-binding factor RbfA [Serpentinicella sp. ANB-PHB4]MDR5658219.1 30S ribosome-binding factor RbfA [Serpentinicella sp. ANB-PHB4]
MAYPRTNRLNEEIKKSVSLIIRNSLKDPRISSMTSITSVEATRDLRYATIYISILGTEREKRETLDGLKKSAGFVRREIGKHIKIRYVPEIIFKLDESIQKGMAMQELISKIETGEKKRSEESDKLNDKQSHTED